MPLATPKPSGEWQAATSVHASRIFGAGPAMAGETTREPRAATPAAPTVFKMARRETRGACNSLMSMFPWLRTCVVVTRVWAGRRRGRFPRRLKSIGGSVFGGLLGGIEKIGVMTPGDVRMRAQARLEVVAPGF